MARIEMSADDSAVIPPKAEAWAWGICWLMFASTVLNYMDRQALALVGPQVKSEFSLTNFDFGWVMAAFALTYALFQVPAGYLVDRWNVRWVYAGAVAWWSLAGMASVLAPTLGVLMVFRALLGVGESFNWPCALRTTARILPPADRGLGNGIFNSGAAVGAVLTPLLVPVLTARYGWRTSFVVIGALGFLWVAAWLWLMGRSRLPIFSGRASAPPAADDAFEATSGGLSSLARAAYGGVLAFSILVAFSALLFGLSALWWAIASLMIGLLLATLVLPPQSLKGSDWAQSLGEVVRLRRFWVMVAVSVSINVCWHYLVNWLPSYLKEDRTLGGFVALLRQASGVLPVRGDLKYLASGLLSAIPFLAADFGNIGGGAGSRAFARRGWSPADARKLVMATCTLLITGLALVGSIRSDLTVILLISAAAMGIAAYMANYFAFVQEVSSKHTGLVVGILGGLGNLFAAGFLPLAGKLKDETGSFAIPFLIVGFLPCVGTAALLLGWGKDRDEARSS